VQQVDSREVTVLFRLESDHGVAAVAKRFVTGCAATAKRCLPGTQNGAAGAAADFHVAFDGKRPVRERGDFQDSVTDIEGFRGQRCRLAGSDEAGILVAVVAKRLVFRCTAAAQGGAEKRCQAGKFQLGVNRQRAIFQNTYDIDSRGSFLFVAVVPCISYGARRAGMGDRGNLFGIGIIRNNPRAGCVGAKDIRQGQHAVT
jgi:hypothetical protein